MILVNDIFIRFSFRNVSCRYNIIKHPKTYKMLVRYILSRVCLRWSNNFSQLYFMKYMELCVFSLPISLVMIVRMHVLYHHRIGSVDHLQLFEGRSWNNGMHCMSPMSLQHFHRMSDFFIRKKKELIGSLSYFDMESCGMPWPEMSFEVCSMSFGQSYPKCLLGMPWQSTVKTLSGGRTELIARDIET